MPHSSGGGSHSGGSHSSHSSHSSSGGYTTISSKNYFKGCRTFVYYRDKQPKYIYSTADLRRPDMSKHDTYKIVFVLALIGLFIGFCGIKGGLNYTPSPLNYTSAYTIKIDDKISILDDDKLMAELEIFKEKTGVTPMIVTDYNESWNKYYRSLENYAYDIYVNAFLDETHWVVIYTEPMNYSGGFNDWYWEGMQGDDTDNILNNTVLDVFNKSLQKYLTADSRYSKSEAFVLAFKDLNEVVMTPVNNPTTMIAAATICSAILISIFFVLNLHYQWTKPYKSKELQEVPNVTETNKPQTATCEYCGGLYVIGTHLKCPHCGAPIKSW